MQSTPGRKQIPSKFHFFAQDALASVPLTRKDVLLAKSQTTKISKYAPRFISKLPILHLSEVKQVKDLKRVKIVQFVSEESFEEPPVNRWRLALQNKFKTVLKYKPHRLTFELIEKYKAFSKVTNVVLRDLDSVSKKKSTSISWNLLRYVPGSVNLKCLDLQINPKTPLYLLQKLNRMPKVLSSLKAARIFVQVSSEDIWNPARPREEISLSCLIENKNILKYLTHLILDAVIGENFPSDFEVLSKECENLALLSLELRDENATKSLRFLKDFKKLEVVRTVSANLLELIDNFSLPPSMKDVEIAFADLTCYEEVGVQKLMEFCEKWKSLKGLVSFKMLALHNPRAMDWLQSLVIRILASIPSLVNFHFDLLGRWSPEDKEHEVRPVDLRSIFKALQAFSDQLQKVHIRCPEGYGYTWASSEDMNFPKLTLLQLERCHILNVETIENIFSAIQKPDLKDNVRVLLDSFIVDSNLALLNLIQTLRESPENSITELSIRIEGLDLGTFDDMFGEILEEAKKTPVMKNVWLTVKSTDDMKDEGDKVLSLLKEMFANVSFKPAESAELDLSV